jgi:CheY-like chemotaxis protein
LSINEAAESLNKDILDLQKKVSEIEGRIGNVAHPSLSKTELQQQTTNAMQILRVNDYPENNLFMVERLNSECIDVVICKTSQEALSDLARMKFDLCISDIERLEEGREVADAGMRLLEKLKSDSPDLPFVFFTSSRSIARY